LIKSLICTIQVNGYVLIVGNNIAHLPLTSLRVIRGQSPLHINMTWLTRYALTTPSSSETTTPSSYAVYDEGLMVDDVWNVSKVYDDMEWQNTSEDDDHTEAWTTASATQVDERLPCSLFVASNVKTNSTSIGLKEVHLTSLHG